MKLHALTLFCFCFVQVRSGSESTVDMRNKFKQHFRNQTNGVSEQFLDDLIIILDTYPYVEFVHGLTKDIMFVIKDHVPKNETTSRIDEYGIRKFKSEERKLSDVEYIEYLKVFQQILSRQLPPKRANGMTNLAFALFVHDATTENIEKALDYLYGTGSNEFVGPVINFPARNATDCSETHKRLLAVNVKLKTMTDIKPEVLQNFAAIIEKFPCLDPYIPDFLNYVVNIIEGLKSYVSYYKSEISACLIKKGKFISGGLNCGLIPEPHRNCGNFHISTADVGQMLKNVETILSTRLADETFCHLINFVKATLFAETPLYKTQKSLEYAFIDVVATTNCSTA